MVIRNYLIRMIVFCLFSTASVVSFSAPPVAIGEVIWTQGSVTAQQPQQKPRLLTRRSAVYLHDTLTTAPTSTGQIIFTDDSALSLRKNTSLQLNQYQHGKTTPPAEDAFVVAVIKGGFRTITGGISKNHPKGYAATTPVATIGVRGTDYSIYFEPNKAKMAVKLAKGSVDVSNKKGTVILNKCRPCERDCKNKLFALVDGPNAAPVVVEAALMSSKRR